MAGAGGSGTEDPSFVDEAAPDRSPPTTVAGQEVVDPGDAETVPSNPTPTTVAGQEVVGPGDAETVPSNPTPTTVVGSVDPAEAAVGIESTPPDEPALARSDGRDAVPVDHADGVRAFDGDQYGGLPVAAPVADIAAARLSFPAMVTAPLLEGRSPAPAGFDLCVAAEIGRDRLGVIRNGGSATGGEKDVAAVCLMTLGADVRELVGAGNEVSDPDVADPVVQDGGVPAASGSVAQDGGGPLPPTQPGGGAGAVLDDGVAPAIPGMTVEYPGIGYRVAGGGGLGSFQAGQPADLVLAAVGLDDAGGPLLFNHPSGLSTDGVRLVMTDVFNNRVLIWNDLPTGNTLPDLVLGQQDFSGNDPGTGRHQMNWPVSSSTADGRLVVTDTNNDRILIWTSFPTRNGQPADIVLSTATGAEKPRGIISWPWGAWTDGERLVTTSTNESRILVWTSFPTVDGQPADLVLDGGGDIGTPRQVVSDGASLLIGDHNATGDGRNAPGTFIWHSFPTVDGQSYDVFLRDQTDPNGPWLRGDFVDDGRLVTMGSAFEVWDGIPVSASATSTLAVLGQQDDDGFDFNWSDFSTVAVAGDLVYVSSGRNVVLGFNEVPSSRDAVPDFVIGGETVLSLPLLERYFLGNPVPATNGTNLFATSDFDQRLYVWREIPDESGAVPDLIYHFCDYRDQSFRSTTQCGTGLPPWDNALHGDVFAAAGKKRLVIWEELPLSGNMPDREFVESIGSAEFGDLRGVAIDDRYFYLADYEADRVWVWEGLPDADSEPVATLVIESPQRMSSDGTYLAVSSVGSRPIVLYRIDRLSSGGEPVTVETGIVRPQGVHLGQGRLIVADTPENQIEIWNSVAGALSGRSSDVVIGAPEATKLRNEIGRDRLFMPGSVASDGEFLWVGEYKFSNRLLRFSPP